MGEADTIGFRLKSAGIANTALFVDDEDSLLGVLKFLCAEEDLEIIYAATGTEGLEKYIQYKDKISLVISDLNMPGMCGDELIKRIKQMNPNTKCICMSGGVYGEDMPGLVQFTDGYIAKPFSVPSLIDKIYSVLMPAEHE